MSEPDNSGFHFASLGPPLLISLFFLFGFYVLFDLREWSYFSVLLWIGVPIFASLISFLNNLATQLVSCNTIDAGRAAIGSLPVIGTVLLGLAISSWPYCRIPIASVFAPLFLGDSMDVVMTKGNTNVNSIKNSNSGKCCSPKVTLESIESKYPSIDGLNRGFYVMFSVLFGFVIGTSVSTIC